MRSRMDSIITKSEVQQISEAWLRSAFGWRYEGTKCTASLVYQILLLAASRVVSIFAACRSLADAPRGQTVRDVLSDLLPSMPELERRANRALVGELPKALGKRSWRIAVDLTLIPYHGKPLADERELYRSKASSGTTKFHAYATAVVVHRGLRSTLALTRVDRGEALKAVVQRLLAIVRKRGVKIRFLLLDKAFFTVSVITYLKRAGHGFLMPAFARGRKPKGNKSPTGLRSLLKKRNGFYLHTMTGKRGSEKKGKTTFTVCVTSKDHTYEKTGERVHKKMMFAVHKVAGQPREIREMYRKRFGIETSYRQMNEARIPTCTRSPLLRLLYFAIALVLRNVWVWLHFQFAKNKNHEEPQVTLELLRFRDMLHGITQTIETLLGAANNHSIDHATVHPTRATGKM